MSDDATSPDPVRSALAELDPQFNFLDGLDNALIGHVTVEGRTYPLYDRERLLELLTDRGMSEAEAEAYYAKYLVSGPRGVATLIREQKTYVIRKCPECEGPALALHVYPCCGRTGCEGLATEDDDLGCMPAGADMPCPDCEERGGSA